MPESGICKSECRFWRHFQIRKSNDVYDLSSRFTGVHGSEMLVLHKSAGEKLAFLRRLRLYDQDVQPQLSIVNANQGFGNGQGPRPATGSDGGGGPVGHEEVNCPEGAREAGLSHHWACCLHRLPCTRRCHGAPRSSRPTGQAIPWQKDETCHASRSPLHLFSTLDSHCQFDQGRGAFLR